MMTNGQHDSMWMDVMGKQVPNGVGYLKHMAEAEKAMASMQFLDKMLERGLIDDQTYNKDLKGIGTNLLHWN